MCGKYILAQAAKAERAMGIRRGRWEYPLSYRVLPSEQVPVVSRCSGEPEAAMMRWGLIPYWAGGVPLKASTINATVERVDSAPSYRDAWRRGQRCIFVDGRLLRAARQRRRLARPVLPAPHRPRGIRRGRAVGPLAARDGSHVFSATLITVPANRLLAEVHNDKQRMPAILAEADHDAWLGGDAEQARATLRPYPDELMVAHAVSRRVNSPNLPNDESLIAPV